MKRAVIAVLALVSVACGDVVREGTSSSYVVVTALEGASGADDQRFGGTLSSDVITLVEVDGVKVPTIFSDNARVDFQLVLKDPGTAGNPASPAPPNWVTFDRYRVRYVRTDGRNVPGVDVPYGFDGAFTITVADTARAGFTVVRLQAKGEAPLSALAATGNIISTIAEITFYGRDQTGREVITTGRISINFGDYADPD